MRNALTGKSFDTIRFNTKKKNWMNFTKKKTFKPKTLLNLWENSDRRGEIIDKWRFIKNIIMRERKKR